jgi:hypothetical protein
MLMRMRMMRGKIAYLSRRAIIIRPVEIATNAKYIYRSVRAIEKW